MTPAEVEVAPAFTSDRSMSRSRKAAAPGPTQESGPVSVAVDGAG